MGRLVARITRLERLVTVQEPDATDEAPSWLERWQAQSERERLVFIALAERMRPADATLGVKGWLALHDLDGAEFRAWQEAHALEWRGYQAMHGVVMDHLDRGLPLELPPVVVDVYRTYSDEEIRLFGVWCQDCGYRLPGLSGNLRGLFPVCPLCGGLTDRDQWAFRRAS